jgi:hypothetical protein
MEQLAGRQRQADSFTFSSSIVLALFQQLATGLLIGLMV